MNHCKISPGNSWWSSWFCQSSLGKQQPIQNSESAPLNSCLRFYGYTEQGTEIFRHRHKVPGRQIFYLVLEMARLSKSYKFTPLESLIDAITMIFEENTIVTRQNSLIIFIKDCESVDAFLLTFSNVFSKEFWSLWLPLQSTHKWIIGVLGLWGATHL